MEQLQAAVAEVERLGEQFLANKAQLVEADKQRQANREALAALRRATTRAAVASAADAPGSDGGGAPQNSPQRKAWLLAPAAAAGGPATFTKHTAGDSVARLEREQARLEERIAALRAEQKRLTAELADRGAGPDESRPGLVRAMLNLRGDGGGGKGGGGGGDEDDAG